MKGIRRNWLLVPAVLSAMALAGPSLAQTTASTERPAAKPKGSQAAKRAPSSHVNGHVYLLRGLLNIFSLGMDDLAAKIQARGISASVHNHSEWQGIADDIAVKYKARAHGPVVLVGHSLGADAVMYMAEYLGRKGVPVALVVPFDGTGSFAASSNVSQVYNLTQRDYAHMRRGSGFRGQLNNVDVSGQGYGHIDIDKSARLHALVLARIQTVIRARGGTRTADDGAPATRTRTTAPAAESGSPAPAPQAAPAAKPSADAAPATPAPATTASTNASANASVERAASAPPAVTRPASVSTESGVKRQPAGSESGAKPALRF
jgi:pimeloyl-ACP methyl ester carboxylesterase